MLLLLQRSAEQDAALSQLMDAQQTKGSGNFHNWLTPEQFGTQFGPSDADIQAVTDWLTQHGFQVAKVAAGRTTIEFSGNAAQVRSAFQTDVHKYAMGETEFIANTADPAIPAALAPVVKGIVALHNYPVRPRARVRGVVRRNNATGELTPLFTYPGGTNCSVTADRTSCVAVGPADFNTIYNVPSTVTGTGQSIAVVGQSNIDVSDIQNFRSIFGLPANFTSSNVILNGPDPGILGPSAVGTTSDEGESDLDIEWAGALAPQAQILFVTSQSTLSNTNQITSGVDLSALYAVDNNIAGVLSESYGACEGQLTSSGNSFYNSLWQQAAAQGITVVIAAGDTGSAGCDGAPNFPGEIAATQGLAVTGTASTPYNVAVGGTDFLYATISGATLPNQYWTSTNTGSQNSALSYIPETPWNNSACAAGFPNVCTSPDTQGGDLTAGGGGLSNVYTTQPPFQISNALGSVLSGAKARAVPDISFFAGNGANAVAYIYCQSDNTTDGLACNLNSPYADFVLIGGTSVPTPAFAGIVALLDQKTGQRQGNINYALYGLAAQDTYYTSGKCTSSIAANPNPACTFNDVAVASNLNGDAWNNSVACLGGSPNCSNSNSNSYGVLQSAANVVGYADGAQYDLATGLGSINVGNLLKNWSNFHRTVSSTNLGSITGATAGGTLTATVIVSPTPSGAKGTETVALNALAQDGKTLLGSIGPFPLNQATANISTQNLLPQGTAFVNATYSGDATLSASTSGNMAFAVQPISGSQTAQTVVYWVSLDPNTGQPTNITTKSQNIPYGSIPYILQIAVTKGGATCGFNYPNTAPPYPCPTGKVTLTDNGSPLNDFPNAGTANATNVAYLNNLGIAEDQPINLSATVGTTSPGVHNIIATYAGDANYKGSASSGLQVTISKGQTAVGVTASVVSGSNITSFVATIATQSNGLGPTGTVTFTNGTTSIGTASCTGSASVAGQNNTSGVNGTNPGTAYCAVQLSNVAISALYPPPTTQPKTPIGPIVLLAFALVLFLALSRWMPANRRRAYAYASLVAFALLATAIVGCGGGGGGGGGTKNVTINVAYPGDVNYSSSSGSVTVTVTN
jgi:subtilase family serine protease